MSATTVGLLAYGASSACVEAISVSKEIDAQHVETCYNALQGLTQNDPIPEECFNETITVFPMVEQKATGNYISRTYTALNPKEYLGRVSELKADKEGMASAQHKVSIAIGLGGFSCSLYLLHGGTFRRRTVYKELPEEA